MTKHQRKQPIGIFDSGIGGLTLTKEVTNLLPNEDIVYFGDTAHAPWGDKSKQAICLYATKICEVLLSHNCKAILIACNTASAVAAETVKKLAGDKVPVINVIDPVAKLIAENYQEQKIGLIATKQTVSTGTYKNKINGLSDKITLIEKAAPLLVPLIEEGFVKDKELTQLVLEKYLKIDEFKDIKAIILGCTHFPLIKQAVAEFFDNKVDVIDASIVATHIKQVLIDKELINEWHTQSKVDSHNNQDNQHHFYISDYNDFFEATAKLFFPGNYKLEKFPLWD